MNRLQLLKAGILAVLCTLALPMMLNVKGNTTAISYSWFSVIVFGGMFYALYRCLAGNKKAEKRTRGISYVCGLILSVTAAFGVMLDREENVNFTDGSLWIAIAVFSLFFGILICRLYLFFDCYIVEQKDAELPGLLTKWMVWWEGHSQRKRAFFLFFFFVLCYLPVFLGVYPGFFVYDAQDEFVQAATRNFTTHHPLPHVFLLGGILLGVNKITGSYNLGIAAYTILQMLFMAGVFTFVTGKLKSFGASHLFRMITVLYFALFPVNVMFVLCSAKDGIFTAALLLVVVFLTEMALDFPGFFKKPTSCLCFIVSAVVMMSFRHNGFYAFLVMTVLLLFFGKGVRRQLAVLLFAAIGSSLLLSGGLQRAVDAKEGGRQEMLTVPIQQLARTYHYNKAALPKEELAVLYEILPEEALSYYAPKVSDGVKYFFNNEAFAKQPQKYAKLWASWGSRYFFTYLNAWFMTSYGFWYPDTIIDVYRGNGVFTFTYEDSSFFGYEVEEPGVRESKIPWVDALYKSMSLEIAQQKIPVFSMLFSPGFLFWFYLLIAGFLLVRKKYRLLQPLAMIFLVWLTVLLGPTYLPRYVLILWFALPIVVNWVYLCYTTHDLKITSGRTHLCIK